MDTVVNLAKFRATKKKLWLASNKHRLKAFLIDFIRQHINVSFKQALDSFQKTQEANNELAWDYLELRDLLQESIEGLFCLDSYEKLKAEWWFDKKVLSRVEVIEQCLSLYLLELETGTTATLTTTSKREPWHQA